MELKKSPTKQHFDENAKEFIINMKNNSRKLHKKNGCQHSRHISEYYDFSTLDEAKQSGINFTSCAICFDKEIKSNAYVPVGIYQKYDKYWNMLRAGAIVFILGLFCILFPAFLIIGGYVSTDSMEDFAPILATLIPGILCFIMGICYLLISKKIKNEYGEYFNEQVKGSHKRYEALIKKVVIITSIITAIVFTVIILTSLSDSSSNSSNRKKCSWCGQMVSADDMQGNWCEDCQNDAFGDDGWYYDIND